MYTGVLFIFALAIAYGDIPALIMSKDWMAIVIYCLLIASGLVAGLVFQLGIGPPSVTRIFIDPVKEYLPFLPSFFARTAF